MLFPPSLTAIHFDSSENYESLPRDSGTDSFINVEWDFRNDKESGFDVSHSMLASDSLGKIMNILGNVADSFISQLKDEWLISPPQLCVKGDLTQAGFKIRMRKKSFVKLLEKERSKKE